MSLKTVIVGAAAAALATAPIVAQATAGRSAAALDDDSGIGGSDTLTRLIVLALIAGAIIGGIELFSDDEPASP